MRNSAGLTPSGHVPCASLPVGSLLLVSCGLSYRTDAALGSGEVPARSGTPQWWASPTRRVVIAPPVGPMR